LPEPEKLRPTLPRPPLHLLLATCALLLAVGTALALRPLPSVPGPASRRFQGGARPLEVGPPVPRAGLRTADCAACHAAHTDQWRASMHAKSWNNPLFLRAFAREPQPFCVHCHAPLARQVPPEPWAQAEGVSCAVCHVRDGTILASDLPRPGTPTRVAPHPLTRTKDLRDASFCAGCHQFGFLGQPEQGPRFETRDLQQSTWLEWRQSTPGRAGQTCQACHMPTRVEGTASGTDHRFDGRSLDLLQAAVITEVSVTRRDGAAWLTVELTPAGAGHAFPTGDLFRRLEVCVRDGRGRVQASLPFAREWQTFAGRDREHGQFTGKRLAHDGRVPPPGQGIARRQAKLRADGGPWTWTLDYVRAETPLQASGSGCLDGERVTLGHGALALSEDATQDVK
jgi:hypothetical protein